MSGTWQPFEAERGPRPVGESLDRVTRSLGMAGVGALRVLFGRWAEVVGEPVAAHCRPLSLRGGRLVIGVDQPGWATQLRYLEHDLLRQVAAVAGEGVVTEVEIRVRPG